VKQHETQQGSFPRGRRARAQHAFALLIAVLAAIVMGSAVAQANPSAVLRVATIGEPPMLDPMATTVASTGAIAQHIFETLYTVDENWAIVPMLATSLPEVSADSLVMRIPLREGIKFHDGSTLVADDVVASLERWLVTATRGRGTAPFVESIEATDDHTVTITLNRVYSPLLSFLAMNTATASIMPKEIAQTEGALTQYVGTGPFSFLEWRPDRYIRLARFEDYQPRSEPASAYGGAREAKVAEIQFIPVPDANTRLAGLIGGEYDYAESLNTESISRLRTSGTAIGDVVEPFAYPVIVFNAAQGAAVDPTTRLAMQAALDLEAMLLAGLGEPEFFKLEGSWYPEGSPFYSDAGTDLYDVNDPERARELLAESSYAGEPIRILTSQQFDFLYRMSIVAADNLRDAGFNVDLQVLEWATLISRRGDPAAWEAYWSYGNFYPEPTAYSFIVGPGAGGWTTDEKIAILDGMNSAEDLDERAAWWGQMQELLYTDAPVIRIGEMYGLAGRSNRVLVGEGHRTLPIPYYWNVALP
jgi:peptide/nickel transport system substrate-binding protein